MATLWDFRASLYDVCEASDYRRGPDKAALFKDMRGRVLFVAVGTGIDIKHFPPGLSIVAIDISDKMLRKADKRARQYRGDLVLLRADAQKLGFPDETFDTVATSCTMCSIPDPVCAFGEFHRVLRPGGLLLMFEHVRSRNHVLGATLDLMTLWTRLSGTEMNRDTLATAHAVGFQIAHIESVYLDIILAVHAVKRGPATCAAVYETAGLPCATPVETALTSPHANRLAAMLASIAADPSSRHDHAMAQH